jgi:hypothetical protein
MGKPDLAEEGFPDFAEEVKVNKYKLDEENENHASKYFYWAKLQAQAKANKDRAEENLDLMLAKRELVIREQLEEDKTLKIKVTESVVKATLEKDEKIQKAREELRAIKAQLYTLDAAVKALEHRRDNLNNLTQLWGKSYYATPDGGPRMTGTDAASRDVRKNLNEK